MTYRYVTLEWRIDHASEDIQFSCERMAAVGYRLAFVLEAERVLVFEAVAE